MKNYEAKYSYLNRRQGFNCAIAAIEGKAALVTDLHHKCHQAKWRHKKFPLFMDSLLNLVGVNNMYHLWKPQFEKISDMRAVKYEAFLSNPIHWKFREFVHTAKWPLTKS